MIIYNFTHDVYFFTYSYLVICNFSGKFEVYEMIFPNFCDKLSVENDYSQFLWKMNYLIFTITLSGMAW